jgi:ABC-type nitrate/sulfonate/bicarbonate transport system substrate-binding protein
LGIAMTMLIHATRALLLLLALGVALPARAVDTVTIGTVGSASANLWPVYIGTAKGFFAAEGLKVDIVFVQSSANMIQQLSAGSLDITMSTGLVDPIRAIDQGAPIAIVRFEAQAPPYALLAKSNIKTLSDLKGKLISLGGAKDITRIYVERMLAPHGVKPGEFDMMFAGATAARSSALLAGAVDAAILLAPFIFQAEASGFNNLGLIVEYAPELPFSGTVVNKSWAAKNESILKRLLSAHTKSVEWFYDDRSRDEAIQMMVTASRQKLEDVQKSYDFIRKNNFFDRSGTVSRKKMTALIDALQSLGDVQAQGNIERFVMPNITQASD